MFTKTLFPDTFRAIKLISKIPAINNAYLAGGTSLALQIGHRISVDLDFFSQKDFDEKILEQELSIFKQFEKEGVAWKTIWGKIEETKFSIFYYKYPLLEKTKKFGGIQLAGLRDIAAMKIQAVANRGTKRDFIDLYFLSKRFSLKEILDFYNQKFADLEEKSYSVLRSLDYFEDAEYEPLPKMIEKIDWDEVKNFFHKEAVILAKTFFWL